MELPAEFAERMQKMLGDDYPAFRTAMEDEQPVRALRLSRKGKHLASRLIDLYRLTPVPYGQDCYYIGGDFDGKHPYHRAGAFYVQDPGAMSAVAALPETLGMRVLDMCAAPGGKSTQIAALIGDDGVLYSNEPVASRCRILTGNLERLGITRSVVMNEMPGTVSALFDRYFDLVLVDAPCSGEGMLRKSEEAQAEWSLQNVAMCAERQDAILDSAATTVRGGGYLLYSTCTFSIEENEGAVLRFLERHPDFTVCELHDSVRRVTERGMMSDADAPTDIQKSARFYPHLAKGEGQYMALLNRKSEAGYGGTAFQNAVRLPSKDELKVAESFLQDTLSAPLDLSIVALGDTLTLLPEGIPVPSCHVMWAGVPLGQVTKGRLVPHHAFFSAFGHLCKRKLMLSADEARCAAYLHGETVDAEGLSDGFAALLVDGVALGGGKVVGGILKNYYPKGLRS